MLFSCRRIVRFLAEEDGPTVAEYAVMLGLILLAAIQMVSLVGSSNSTGWQRNANQIISASAGRTAGG
jgi:Flp pilus assembly pilin Flp